MTFPKSHGFARARHRRHLRRALRAGLPLHAYPRASPGRTPIPGHLGVWVLMSALLPACGSSVPATPPPSTACGAGQPATSSGRSVSGTLTYDRAPETAQGLDYANIRRLPIRGAILEVRDGTSVLAAVRSDDLGRYSVSWTGKAVVTVRIKAETVSPAIRVEDNTQGNALYTMESCVDSTASNAGDLHAASGWGGNDYTQPRVSGPFAILDSLYGASHAFMAQRSVVFPPLSVAWSVRNVGVAGDPQLGQISGTHYDREEQRIYVRGLKNENTDEFDAHLLIHEWGHHFLNQLSRSDDRYAINVGYNSFGVVHDPRLAWNEGWASAVAAMVLYPDDLYRDTDGARQARAFEFDIENDVNGSADECPGWFSSNTVAHIVYDLFDAATANEPFDAASLSLGETYDLLVGAQRETEAFTTLFSFLDGAKRSRPDLAATIDAIGARYGVVPVVDPWGTGETNDAPGTCTGGPPSTPGVEGLLPPYHLLTIDGPPASLVLTLDDTRFLVNPVRFARFEGDGTAIDLTADIGSGGPPVTVQVFDRGVLVGTSAQQPNGTSVVGGLATTAARTYTVAVTGPGRGPYTTPVSLALTRH